MAAVRGGAAIGGGATIRGGAALRGREAGTQRGRKYEGTIERVVPDLCKKCVKVKWFFCSLHLAFFVICVRFVT